MPSDFVEVEVEGPLVCLTGGPWRRGVLNSIQYSGCRLARGHPRLPVSLGSIRAQHTFRRTAVAPVKSPGWKAAYAPGLAGKMRWSLGASVRSPTSLSEPVKKAVAGFLSPREEGHIHASHGADSAIS
jgi:hypothetical protein